MSNLSEIVEYKTNIIIAEIIICY